MPRACWFFRVAAVFFAGCAPAEEVQSYRAPKPVEYRILGGMFPADNPVWFFKVTGRADQLEAQATAIDAFLGSVRFPNGIANGPFWDLPAGWTATGPTGMRHDTLKFADGKLELAVSEAKGGLAENLGRWAKQLGVPPQTYDPAKAARAITTASGTPGLRVDLTGPTNPAASGPPMMGGS